MDETRAQVPNAGGDDSSDNSLLRRYRAGSEDAAARLFERYSGRVRAVARAKSSRQLERLVDSEDIVQSVFRRFFADARAKDYEVPTGEDLWKLLLVITLNRVRAEERFQRRAKRDVGLTLDLNSLAELLTEDKDAATWQVFEMALDDELSRLPELYRTVVLQRLEGYNLDEISARVSRSKRTIERILHELRKLLHGVLEKENGDDSHPASPCGRGA